LVILQISTSLVFLYDLTESHETAHRMIMEYYGCDQVITHISLFEKSFTACLDDTEITEAEIFLHSLNEVIGYNVRFICLSLFLGPLVPVLILYLKR